MLDSGELLTHFFINFLSQGRFNIAFLGQTIRRAQQVTIIELPSATLLDKSGELRPFLSFIFFKIDKIMIAKTAEKMIQEDGVNWDIGQHYHDRVDMIYRRE